MGRHQTNAVLLTEEERALLEEQTKQGTWTPREVTRAKILLLADFNGPHCLQDEAIAKRLNCSLSSVAYRRKRFTETKSLEDTIFDKARSGRPTIVDAAVEAHVTMIACSEPPEGYAKWSLNLIRDRVVSLKIIDDISPATVGRMLKKKSSNPG